MIRQLREYFGISQDEMARQLGISRSHLAMIESGKRELNSEKHTRLGKLFLAINGIAIKDTAISNEKAILPDHAGEERFFGCVKLELLTYRHRLLKVNRQIRTLQTSRERKAKRFMRIDMLEHAGEKASECVNIRTHARPPSLPARDAELLKLKIKKCSYEAALKFLEGHTSTAEAK